MDWQQLASLAIVFTAAALLLRSKIHRPKFRLARHSPCGCSGKQMTNPPPTVIYRARKGDRPTITIRPN